MKLVIALYVCLHVLYKCSACVCLLGMQFQHHCWLGLGLGSSFASLGLWDSGQYIFTWTSIKVDKCSWMATVIGSRFGIILPSDTARIIWRILHSLENRGEKKGKIVLKIMSSIPSSPCYWFWKVWGYISALKKKKKKTNLFQIGL